MTATLGSINFSCVDLFGSMSVCCNNCDCKYYDNKVCLLFRITLDENGACESFEKNPNSNNN